MISSLFEIARQGVPEVWSPDGKGSVIFCDQSGIRATGKALLEDLRQRSGSYGVI